MTTSKQKELLEELNTPKLPALIDLELDLGDRSITISISLNVGGRNEVSFKLEGEDEWNREGEINVRYAGK